MAKLIEMSVLIALVLIPARAAREADPVRGLKLALKHTLWFNFVYLFVILYVHGKFAS